MPLVSITVARPPLLASLRAATAAAHAMLDSRFSSLDLTSETGYRRFLVGHAIGWQALGPVFDDFVAGALAIEPPRYRAMLAHDLADLGSDAALLPMSDVAVGDCPAAVSYVLAGSRMGIAMIRRQPNWADANGRAGRYLADPGGPDLFRSLRAWMDGADGQAIDQAMAGAAACDAFALFADAFARSQPASGTPS